MLSYLCVGLGGALGSMARLWAASIIMRRFGGTFPFGTLFVNVSGSFVIGFFATLTAPDGRWPMRTGGRSFFMAGICGGYTTFSAFGLETLNLARNEAWSQAGANALLSFSCCLIAVWLGHLLAVSLNPSSASR
jgi:CrcB protein